MRMNEFLKVIKQLFKKGFFHIFGGSVLNKIIGFLSSIVLVRLLTKAEYGIFTYAWNIYSIILLANGCGLDLGALQLCSEHGQNTLYARRMCGYCAKNGALFNILLLIVLLGIGVFVPLKIEGADVLLMMLCALPIVKVLYNTVISYLRAQRRNQDFAKLSTINVLIVFVASAICVVLFREKGMVIGYYVGYATSLLTAYYFFNVKLFPTDELPSQNDRRSLWSISLVSMCNNGLSELLYLLDTFVLGIVVAEETTLATYKVATIIPSTLVFIPHAIITYIYPYFAAHREDGNWCMATYRKVLAAIGSLNLLVAVALFVLAPFIIDILYGESYLDTVPIMRLLAINFFFSGTFRILSGNLLVTQRKLKFNFYVALIAGIVNALADYWFIQWWGSMGAAFATILVVMGTSIINTVYLVLTFKRNSTK